MTQQDKVPSVSQTGMQSLLPLGKLQREIDHLFHSFQSDLRIPNIFGTKNESFFMPNIDVHEDEKTIKVSAELPGVDEENIDVELHDDILTVSGQKKSETEKKDGEYFHRECSYGSFSRSLSLPSGVDENAVDAKFNNGVLTITVQKPENAERKTKKVPVQAN